ncbi:MAG: DegT/DnrJ/EryC1/StrS family aminotransferase [Aquificaceae bacterium]
MINIIEPRFSDEEKEVVLEILKSGHITRGKWTALFQEEFAKYLGVKHIFTVCSGTAALFVALKALGVEGKPVILPAMSFMATIDAVYLAGGIPVVVDVDEYYTMDPDQLEEAVKRYNPKAVIPVHLYGQTTDMDAILWLSQRYGFYVLEDSAQAHGAKWKDKRAGSLGHVSAFSFYASKNLPMGEGGAIATNDEGIAQSIKKWIDFGEHPAFNLRITEFQAGIGHIQLKKLEKNNQRRREIAQKYMQYLNGSFVHPKEREGAYHVYHLYTLRHPQRDGIVAYLKERGIDARVYYSYLLHGLRGAEHLPTPRAERFKGEVFSIPVHPYLTEENTDYIIESLLSSVELTLHPSH